VPGSVAPLAGAATRAAAVASSDPPPAPAGEREREREREKDAGWPGEGEDSEEKGEKEVAGNRTAASRAVPRARGSGRRWRRR